RWTDLSASTRRLLRRHVIGRTEWVPRQGQGGLRLDNPGWRILRQDAKPLGQAEVRKVRLTCAIDEHIRGFEVAMQDPALMRVMDSLGQRLEPLGRQPELMKRKAGSGDHLG